VQQAHTFGAIANFVVNSRSRFVRNFIFDRPEAASRTDEIKKSVPKFVTDAKRRNDGGNADENRNRQTINVFNH
jgi:hypothetical protein